MADGKIWPQQLRHPSSDLLNLACVTPHLQKYSLARRVTPPVYASALKHAPCLPYHLQHRLLKVHHVSTNKSRFLSENAYNRRLVSGLCVPCPDFSRAPRSSWRFGCAVRFWSHWVWKSINTLLCRQCVIRPITGMDQAYFFIAGPANTSLFKLKYIGRWASDLDIISRWEIYYQDSQTSGVLLHFAFLTLGC